MRMLVGVAAFVLVMAGCKAPDLSVDCGPRPTEEEAALIVKGWCNQNLKDPMSAVISNVRVVGKAAHYKGLVNGGGYRYGWEIAFSCNAKNGYGGYTGTKTMVLMIDIDKNLWTTTSI